MNPDQDLSRYREVSDASKDFDRIERRRLRLILRRLQFLEQKVREEGGLANPRANGGAAYTEWEIEALEWILGPEGLGFIIVIPRDDD